MSELSQISTMNTKQDANKQLAYIRSYLIQLKDEIEAELNNVTYNMLSPDLRKRIDLISDDVVVSGDDKNNGQLVVDSIIARYAKIGTLEATLGTIDTLISQVATLLQATITDATINTATIIDATIDSASIADLTTGGLTVDGDANIDGTLDVSTEIGTDKVTCNSISGTSASFGNVTVPGIDISTNSDGEGVITTDHLNVASVNGGLSGLNLVGGVDHSQGSITVGSSRADSFGIYDGSISGYRTLTLQTITDADGNSYKLLGYKL